MELMSAKVKHNLIKSNSFVTNIILKRQDYRNHLIKIH